MSGASGTIRSVFRVDSGPWSPLHFTFGILGGCPWVFQKGKTVFCNNSVSHCNFCRKTHFSCAGSAHFRTILVSDCSAGCGLSFGTLLDSLGYFSGKLLVVLVDFP